MSWRDRMRLMLSNHVSGDIPPMLLEDVLTACDMARENAVREVLDELNAAVLADPSKAAFDAAVARIMGRYGL